MESTSDVYKGYMPKQTVSSTIGLLSVSDTYALVQIVATSNSRQADQSTWDASPASTAGRRRRRRYGRGLFNKTTITPDIVMYGIARRDLSTTERLPVPLYGDRISMPSRDPPPTSQCARDMFARTEKRHLSQNASTFAPLQNHYNMLGV